MDTGLGWQTPKELEHVCLDRILMLVCYRRSFPSELTFGWQRLVTGVKPVAVQPYKADLCHCSGKQRCLEVQHIPLPLPLWVSLALRRGGNKFFFNPDSCDIQGLFWAFTSVCTLHMYLHIKFTSFKNAAFLH